MAVRSFFMGRDSRQERRLIRRYFSTPNDNSCTDVTTTGRTQTSEPRVTQAKLFQASENCVNV